MSHKLTAADTTTYQKSLPFLAEMYGTVDLQKLTDDQYNMLLFIHRIRESGAGSLSGTTLPTGKPRPSHDGVPIHG